MNPQEAVVSVLTQYATFTGRARRSEFWYWTLLSGVASYVGTLIGVPVLDWVVLLATLLPSLAVGARRLHDTNRSGWWQLLGLIPIVGWIILIVWWAQDSHADNEYGPSPKGHSSGTFDQPPPAPAV